MVSFPETERLSVLQFAILGHEIGHIFAKDYIESKNLNELYRTLFETFSEIQKNGDDIDLFTPYKHVGYCKNILKELISDIFGVLLFGPSTLIAFYIFCVGVIEKSDNRSWKNGYLSPIYRLSIMKDAIIYISQKKKIELFPDDYLAGVYEEISKRYKYTPPENEYIQAFVKILDKEIPLFCDTVVNEIKDEIFTNHHDGTEIETVIQHLKLLIPPCSSLNSFTLEQAPINFRNILYGTCKYIFESSTSDASLESMVAFAKQINLLSLKAIEMSAEQKRFKNACII